jgi:signal transduction histidine kinase
MKGVLALALVWACTLVSAGVIAARSGSRIGKIYLAAWLAFLLGSVVNVLRAVGALPTNVWTSSAQQVGSVVEFILLSFALADRIKELQALATAHALEAARNAELAAANARAAEEASAMALAEQERVNNELQRMDKLKDAFLANTSHELRTPLNGILGLVETTISGSVGAVPGPVKRNLELVRASGRRLATLVNDILDFSKLRESGVALRERPLAFRNVVELTLQTLTPLANDKSLRLVNEVPEPVGVRADEDRLQQILTNLVGNAIKFTHEGHVLVRAHAANGRICVIVQDTGIGIPKDAQSRIFESFEQGDGSTAREYGGTGLGLSVTKNLVELHGGTLGVESEPGKGSTFTFDLAVAEVPSAALASARVASAHAPSSANADVAAVEPAPSTAPPQGLRVLVVDDEPINREVLAQHLTAKGFEVSHAQDGEQAIARIEADKPDVVLLDVMMPKKTGYDVLESVRPKLEAHELPVLLLTAKAQESDLQYGFSLGASDYLLKPVSFVELDARLGHHAKLVRAGRSLAAELEERRRLQGELDRATHHLMQAENMATLGMLMAGIAHDLRNPLHYVQGAAEELEEALPLLKSERAEDRDRAIAAVATVVPWVRQGVTSMDAISRAMRNQSRAGGAELDDVNVHEVIVEALLLCRSRCAACTVDVDVDPIIVEADATGLGQLVMNLVSNAADALKEARDAGRAERMAILVRAKDLGAGRFSLEVHDSGPGIPESLRARILEPFFTTKPRGVGTGLGLAIVQRVVRDHRGTLTVDRSPELGGARFRAAFPGPARAALRHAGTGQTP